MVEGFGVGGIAECGGEGRYEVVSAIRVIQKRQNRLWNILGRGVVIEFSTYSKIPD
jgi:hypothetical protein